MMSQVLRRWPRPWEPLVVVAPSAAVILVVLYVIYRLLDPLPPRHFAIAAGIPESPYDNAAKQYARILAHDGVKVEVRNSMSAVENLDLLRDATSGVQAALTPFGFTQSRDTESLYSLGGIFDSAIFIFYRNTEPITRFAQFRGRRLSIGTPRSALRSVMAEVLEATGVVDASRDLVDLDYGEALEALVRGHIDVAMFPSRLDGSLLRRALDAPGIRLMSVAQADTIAKLFPGLKHVILSLGLVSLSRDIPNADIDLLALRSRVLVRKDLHPALQYLLLEAMREVHSAPGPFNRLGEFPAEQPNDLPLSPTAQAFYRSGPIFWQRYTAFWLTSLLNRIVFFVIPFVAMLIPLIGLVKSLYRWLSVRQVGRLHRALGRLEDELARSADESRAIEYRTRLGEIESAVRLLRVARSFEVDLHLLRIHLRMAQEDVKRMTRERVDGDIDKG